jgi:hypothetical protein
VDIFNVASRHHSLAAPAWNAHQWVR